MNIKKLKQKSLICDVCVKQYKIEVEIMNLRVTGMGRIHTGRNLGENIVNPAVVYEILKKS